MTIAFFTENYYVGGLDTFIITLINNWPDDRDKIILICNKSHPGIERYEKEITRKVEFLWHDHFHKNYLNKSILKNFNSIFLLKVVRRILEKMSVFISLYYLFALKKTLFKFKPDRLMVINGGYSGGLSCRIATICWGIYSNKKNAIHNFHNIATPTNKFNIYENFIDRLVEKYSERLISVSNVAAESIRKRKPFRESKKISYIYNGIAKNDDSNYKDLRDELSINKDSKVCLMLGTYEERKGHSFILKAFKEILKKHEDTVLMICGYGSLDEKRKVIDFAKELEVYNNVIFLDFISEINNLFAISDLLLIGSQSFESFGLTAVEAMLNKTPVVSTNTGGLKEVIKNNQGGFVFDKNDYINFAKKAQELLTNKELRIEQGIRGYNRVLKMFSSSRMSKEYYNAVTKKN